MTKEGISMLHNKKFEVKGKLIVVEGIDGLENQHRFICLINGYYQKVYQFLRLNGIPLK